MLQTEREQTVAQRDRAAAAARQAELNLSYTDIVAAVDGTVGARSIRVGQYVTSGTQLMAVVPLHAVYVVANFKETQLTYISPGQSVEIKVDSFPDISIKGHVDSVSLNKRPGILAAAAGQCHRQFHQDRSAHPGQDRHRRRSAERPVALGHVGRA